MYEPRRFWKDLLRFVVLIQSLMLNTLLYYGPFWQSDKTYEHLLRIMSLVSEIKFVK